ncbi:hypothetical protein BGI36_00945 [Snodgrassella communis]|jgi:hypothetical protein|nr:hypothetical protein BGI36_00945 [Snodgrassella communis]
MPSTPDEYQKVQKNASVNCWRGIKELAKGAKVVAILYQYVCIIMVNGSGTICVFIQKRAQ